jgi:hypothetical protein
MKNTAQAPVDPEPTMPDHPELDELDQLDVDESQADYDAELSDEDEGGQQ